MNMTSFHCIIILQKIVTYQGYSQKKGGGVFCWNTKDLNSIFLKDKTVSRLWKEIMGSIFSGDLKRLFKCLECLRLGLTCGDFQTKISSNVSVTQAIQVP